MLISSEFEELKDFYILTRKFKILNNRINRLYNKIT